MDIVIYEAAKKQGLKRYFTGKPCIKGHLSERIVNTRRCAECARLNRKKNYDENKERNELYRRKYLTENKEDLYAKGVVYRKKNKDIRAAKNKAYREKNKHKIALKDKQYRIKNPYKDFIRKTLRRMEEAVNKERVSRAELSLGYTQKQFKQHIELMFIQGMSWKNRSEWHIDHIKPISLFLKEGVTDIKIINSLVNLQPLWAKDNLTKGCKY